MGHDTAVYALTRTTSVTTGVVDVPRCAALSAWRNTERYYEEKNSHRGRDLSARRLPIFLPKDESKLAQAHCYLGTNPLAKIDNVFPYVWEEILKEQLSVLPVAKR